MDIASFNQLSLSPLGAGDLIDRAVRLYRQHFMVFIRIATPPIVVSTVGAMLWTIGWRGVMVTSRDSDAVLYGLLVAAGVILTFGGMLSNLIVMGGAARNLVTHLLWNEPFTARRTYRNVRERFWGLLGASIVIAIFIALSVLIASAAWLISYLVVILAVVAMAQIAVWLAALVGIIGALTISLFALYVFLFVSGRVAYVPQVMLVEGKGVGQALTRSFHLARGNTRRLLAMFLFTTFAAQSALMILIIPLGWYGSLNGVNVLPWNADAWPTWYAIGYSVVGQVSQILLLPVWMLGLSLLYVDERVRHEGYDIELLAVRLLGEMPTAWTAAASYTPAIVTQPQPPPQSSVRPPGSTLGLR